MSRLVLKPTEIPIEYYILAEKNVVTAHLHVMPRVRCGTIFVLFHLLSYHFVPVLQNYSEKSFLTEGYSLLDIKINLLTTGSQHYILTLVMSELSSELIHIFICCSFF